MSDEIPPSEEQMIEAFNRVIDHIGDDAVAGLLDGYDLIDLADRILMLHAAGLVKDPLDDHEFQRAWSVSYVAVAQLHTSRILHEEDDDDAAPE
jgi:hypothetical protein